MTDMRSVGLFFYAIASAVVFLCPKKERNEKGERNFMKGEEKVNRVEIEDVTALLCHLADNASEIPLMSRVMMARTVGDLIDLNLEIDDILSLFLHVDKMGLRDEFGRMFPDQIAQKLKDLPVKKKGRRLFI